MKMNERYHENLPALIEADQKNKERIAEVVPELYKECLEKREDTQYCEEEVKTVVAYLYYNEYY